MAGVAGDLVIGEGGEVRLCVQGLFGDSRGSPTGDGRDDGEFVVALERGLVLERQVADVVVIDIDVDEGAELAVGGEEVLLQGRVGLRELLQGVADGGRVELDGGLLAGEAAERVGIRIVMASVFRC